MTILAIVIAFALLDPPWRWVLIIGALIWEVFEIAIFLRWRNVKPMMGHNGMVGTKGRTVTECRPTGQARIKGQLWAVHCPDGAARDQDVVVTAVDGMTLRVAPIERSSMSEGA